ncbi:UDP-4-amino-4,6-dideoxy-N-acetyl-beta-L-altrosamine N-acetyltransferase [Flavobacterium sp. IB48]|uniref:UDP-4-amino-4, 6-dideoxy-N-acetyl-beta-L-altrosamine N-acetyltransferase n=1 Tax=Flavobacterium sp. IB48 TaxID=2779375 RepID=UPI0018E7C9FD|nr:UDP-4-amino-4,6-dideoxy-N-acetyl-beta-L-altrosamine N-acetyltransferase [Flavobacterium sp. IB48]MBJ2126453.1 UDP-4-amino-4,6-dideoxy-N-acetyl-beta-L-altrosamine N-acetyltransferase [Flavobacterium sp. IB48]
MGCKYTYVNFTDLNNEELLLVFNWRNNYEVRRWMYSTDLVELDNHFNFVERLKTDKSKLYFLVKRNNLPVGTFSLTAIEDDEAEWGYYIAPDYHHKNIGVEFYYYVLEYIYLNLKMKTLKGYALTANKSANSFSDLFSFSKVISEFKSSENSDDEYFFRELTENVWREKVIKNKKIERLLELTVNSII